MRHQRRHRRVVLSAAIAVVALTASSAPSATSSSTAVRDGGIFQISLAVQAGLDNMDPALSFTAPGWALLDTVCARLMAYPDKRPPAGLRLQPEVAAAPPTVSRDLKTFTFTLRKGFRFSDGSPVRASAFARAINRTLAPSMKSPGALFTRHIVGAADVLAGKRRTATGVVARGDTLIVRFTRAAPEFPALTTLPFFCAVPPTLPVDAEGIGVFPTAGPYRVTEYRPGERVVIRRNPFYGGSRPHHVDGFDVDLRATVARRADQAHRARRGGLDHQPDAGVPEPGARAGGEVRHQSLAVLLPARAGPADVRLQLVEAALPEQPGAAQGGELRARPAGAAGDRRRPPGRPAHRPVHPPARARLPRRRRLSTRARRSGAGKRAGARQPPRRQGGLLYGRLRPPSRRRAARKAAAGGDRARDRDQAPAGAHRQRGVPRHAREAGCGVGHRTRGLDAEPARPAGLSQPAARQPPRRRNQRRRLHFGRL